MNTIVFCILFGITALNAILMSVNGNHEAARGWGVACIWLFEYWQATKGGRRD